MCVAAKKKGSFYLQGVIRDAFMLTHIMDKDFRLTSAVRTCLKTSAYFIYDLPTKLQVTQVLENGHSNVHTAN